MTVSVILTGGGAATGVNYGSSTDFRLQNGSADNTTTYTIMDVVEGTCQTTIIVMQNNCCNIIKNNNKL